MSFIQFLEKKKRTVFEENYILLIQDCEIREKKLIEKIHNYIERFYLNDIENDILEKIKKDKLYACFFMKDPKKQNIYEKCQMEYLSNKYKDIKKSSNICFYNGNIIYETLPISTKSIDFISEQYKIYFAAKHIDGYGGHQDNQYRDLFNFIIEYKKIKNIEYKLFIIISGTYFIKKIIDMKIHENENISIIDLNKIDENKKTLGQFYTNNYDKILDGVNLIKLYEIVKFTKIIEPFVGKGDLLEFIDNAKLENVQIECYDLDPQLSDTSKYIAIKKDTLKEPPDYTNSFVITNPPYLARNKCKNKEIFDLYNENDLYKCFIKTIINKVNGGILILPLNFFCNIRKIDQKIRKSFLSQYKIIRLNIFEESVFDDTGYTVCSFSFIKEKTEKQDLDIYFYPSKKNIKISISKDEDWIIGYEIYNGYLNKDIKINRLLENESQSSNLLLHAIDNNKLSNIRLEYVDDEKIYYGKISSRNQASICWNVNLDDDDQKQIAILFNKYLNEKRKKYNSLFLTNYRENNRKRISFELAFNIINKIIIIYCKKNNINLNDII